MKKLLKKPMTYIIAAVLVIAVTGGVVTYAVVTGDKTPATQSTDKPIAMVTSIAAPQSQASKALTSAPISAEKTSEAQTATLPPVAEAESKPQAAITSQANYNPPIEAPVSEDAPLWEHIYNISNYSLAVVTEEEILKLSRDMTEYDAFEMLGKTYFKRDLSSACYLTKTGKLVMIPCKGPEEKLSKSGAELLADAIILRANEKVEPQPDERFYTCIDGMAIFNPPYDNCSTVDRCYVFITDENGDTIKSDYGDRLVFEDGTPATWAELDKTGTQYIGTRLKNLELRHLTAQYPRTWYETKITILK